MSRAARRVDRVDRACAVQGPGEHHGAETLPQPGRVDVAEDLEPLRLGAGRGVEHGGERHQLVAVEGPFEDGSRAAHHHLDDLDDAQAEARRVVGFDPQHECGNDLGVLGSEVADDDGHAGRLDLSRVADMVFPSGDQFEIAAAGYTAVVTESGAALRSLMREGRALVHGFREDQMSSGGRGQLLMPWPNRIRDGRYTFGGREPIRRIIAPPDERLFPVVPDLSSKDRRSGRSPIHTAAVSPHTWGMKMFLFVVAALVVAGVVLKIVFAVLSTLIGLAVSAVVLAVLVVGAVATYRHFSGDRDHTTV